MKNIITSTILVLALLLPALATAADFMVDGIYYNINGNEATVTYRGLFYYSVENEYSGSVVIPATVTHNGTTYPVTSIGTLAFGECTGLTSIVIPNSVTEIGQQAFAWCPGLTSIVVESGNPRYDSRNNCNAIIETADNTLIAGCKSTTIPNSVTAIGGGAFWGCDGLTSIVIPNSVTAIGEHAFYSCKRLTSIVVESGNPIYDSRNNCNAIIETASNTLIVGCNNTMTPNSVTAIGDDALAYCKGLTSIDIPNSVTAIGDWAFSGCTGLTDVYCYIADLSGVSCGNRPFDLNNGDYSGRTLHVLQGTADAYRADKNWYPYFGQIVEDLKPDVPGDVNGDGEVNIADINAVIDIILNGSKNPSGDVNGDGETNIADINSLIDIILGGA